MPSRRTVVFAAIAANVAIAATKFAAAGATGGSRIVLEARSLGGGPPAVSSSAPSA